MRGKNHNAAVVGWVVRAFANDKTTASVTYYDPET